MKCKRCAGLLNRERASGVTDGKDNNESWGWRCVNCGEIVDLVILANRRRMDLAAAGLPEAHKHPIAA
jgi:hypothetical protein